MDTTTEHDLVVYQVINEHFRQDVREFWVRSNFYLLVQAGLLSVYVAAGCSSTPMGFKSTTISIFVLGVIGFVLAIVWFIVARGSVIWIRLWRQQMIELDDLINRHHSYAKIERHAIDRPLQSPSEVTQFIPLSFAAAWLLLLGITILHAIGYIA